MNAVQLHKPLPSVVSVVYFDQQMGALHAVLQSKSFFLIIRLAPEFFPASGPTEQGCASTVGPALLISSRAGSDLGLVSRLV